LTPAAGEENHQTRQQANDPIQQLLPQINRNPAKVPFLLSTIDHLHCKYLALFEQQDQQYPFGTISTSTNSS
jgi:hypothetical protein